eukprot:scaffold819_cov239-Pinguiococcus_pyrenoidosus.AAC.7
MDAEACRSSSLSHLAGSARWGSPRSGAPRETRRRALLFGSGGERSNGFVVCHHQPFARLAPVTVAFPCGYGPMATARSSSCLCTRRRIKFGELRQASVKPRGQ